MTTTEMVARKNDREVRPGSWVKEARLLCGVTSQMRLAVMIGRDKGTVTRWEGRDGEIDYVSWIGVLTLLGLPPTWKPGDALPQGWKHRP
jgi:hypothetical protein